MSARARQDAISATASSMQGFALQLGNYTQTSGRPTFDLDEIIGTEWTTIIIDLNAVDPNLLKLVEEEGEYNGKLVFDHIQVTFNSTTSVYDIDFMGFAENLAALESIAGGHKATLVSGVDKATSIISLRDGGEYVEDPVVLDADFFTKHTPRVDWALSATVAEDGATRFTSTQGTAAEQCIIQVGRDGMWTDTINVATAKFLVIKAKASRDDLTGWMILGTGDGVAACAGYKTIYINFGTEYATYVVNLEELHGDWAATDGAYIIDKLSLVFNFAAADRNTAYADVDYVAFATSWAQVAEIVDVDTVKYATTLGTGSTNTMTTVDQDITVDPTADTVTTNVAVKLD